MRAVDRVRGALLRALLDLPVPVQRLLAGRPVRPEPGGDELVCETQLMLRLQRLAGEPGIETLPLAQARVAMDRQTAMTGGHQRVGEVRELVVDGADGPLPARLYVPSGSMAGGGGGGEALVVWFHGGGFVYGGLDSADPSCRLLAERSGVRLLSVDYRLAPEHRHPAQAEDCAAAYRWALANAETLGAARGCIGVGGDSAGGWLAAVTALDAAGAGLPCAGQLLVYPMTDPRGGAPSRGIFGPAGLVLTTRFIEQAEEAWLAPDRDRSDPAIALVLRDLTPDVVSGLAPAFIATAGLDPLRDEGEQYAALLRAAGGRVEVRRYRGMVHGFLNLCGAGHRTVAAVTEVADALGTLLSPRSPADRPR